MSEASVPTGKFRFTIRIDRPDGQSAKFVRLIPGDLLSGPNPEVLGEEISDALAVGFANTYRRAAELPAVTPGSPQGEVA